MAFVFELNDDLGDLLESLTLLVIQVTLLLGDLLETLPHVVQAGHSMLLLELLE